LSIPFPTFAANHFYKFVTDPTAQFSNDTYFEGLRNADAGTIEALYAEFRKPIARAVEGAGGSASDGTTFFRVAALQTASLARDMRLNENIPVYYLLKNLAIAHFRDWATEKGLELPEIPATSEDEAALHIELPDAGARAEFRQFIRARRQFVKLDGHCQKVVHELAKDAALGIADPRLEGDASETCLNKYRESLGDTAENWAGKMPAWAVTALTDEHFQKNWSTADALEGRLAMGQAPAKQLESKTTRNIFIAAALLLIIYGLWDYFSAAKTPKAVYDENFKPPASIMADRAARFAHDTLPVEHNAACETLFEEADTHYKQKDFEEAASILYTMTGEEMEGCNSDALFYLGIIGLHLDEPDVTIDCFAKIPDLDRFGEDLYWYQALAFVKIAAKNPTRRDIARRAVDRARSNTEIPERRAQAEKLLEQLADN
jgi:hypothetical protein